MYSPTHKGYKYFDPGTYKWYITKDVTSMEHIFYFFNNSPGGSTSGKLMEQKIQFIEFLKYTPMEKAATREGNVWQFDMTDVSDGQVEEKNGQQMGTKLFK